MVESGSIIYFSGIKPVGTFLAIPLKMLGAYAVVGAINRSFKCGKNGFNVVSGKSAIHILALCMVDYNMLLKFLFKARKRCCSIAHNNCFLVNEL